MIGSDDDQVAEDGKKLDRRPPIYIPDRRCHFFTPVQLMGSGFTARRAGIRPTKVGPATPLQTVLLIVIVTEVHRLFGKGQVNLGMLFEQVE